MPTPSCAHAPSERIRTLPVTSGQPQCVRKQRIAVLSVKYTQQLGVFITHALQPSCSY